MFGYVLAAACHDVDHPGFSNPYLIEKRDKLAIRYNDESVLESHHVATTFGLLALDKYNMLCDLDTSQYKKVRKMIIGAILSTDMSKHFNKLAAFKSKILSEDLDPIADKQFICEQYFHFADISNPTKPWEMCHKWTELLFIEFFN